jgi:hypothetical protein
MIEVVLALKLDSFLVNSVGGSGELAGKMPTHALGLICEKISSVRHLTGSAPSANFDFLGSSIQLATKIDSGKEFDEQLVKYLETHATVDISRVNIASGASGYSTAPKGVSTGEIGRMVFAKSADQSRVDIELVLQGDEFDAVWALTTGQNIRNVIATLVCFQLKLDNPAPHSETTFVAGIVSSSLRMMPHTSS